MEKSAMVHVSEIKMYYVYDRDLAKKIKYDNGIPWVTTAKSLSSGDQFWQFVITPELKRILNEHTKSKHQVKIE